MSQQVTIQNFLKHTFSSIKERDRYIAEGKSTSTLEFFYDQLGSAFGLKLYKPSNAEVESFYRGSTSEADFVATVWQNVIVRVKDSLDSDLNPLATICWDMYCSVRRRKELCERVPRLSGRQLWAIFNKLDTEGRSTLHLDDITDLVLRIHLECDRKQTEQDIQEWFCNQVYVDFWSFFSALAENHLYLLQAQTIHAVYEQIFYEVLKQGKMTKKGHKIASWKERWFVLTTSSLAYYESLTNRTLKGSVAITERSHVDKIPAVKGRSYLFRVTDGQNDKPYEISAQDPQILENWVEILNVVIALHSETGRNLLHRLRLARERLSSGKGLPKYKKQSDPALPDYSVGSYDGVAFTVPLDQVESAVHKPNPVSSRELPPLPPAEASSHPPLPDSPEKRAFEEVKLRKKPPPPQVMPYKRRSCSPDIQGVDFSSSLGELARGASPQVPQQPVSQVRPATQMVAPHKRRTSVPELEFGEAHVSVDSQNYSLLGYNMENGQKEEEETENSIAKPPFHPPYAPASDSPTHSPLRGTKSAGYALGRAKPPGIDYIELAFQGDGQLKMMPVSEKEAAPVKPAALKTRFNYSTVVPMSPDTDVAQDVVKALQLKSSKPAMPPAPPRPYNAHAEANNGSVSVPATPDGVGENGHPPPAPLPRTSAPAVPVRHGISRNAHSDPVLDRTTGQANVSSPVTGGSMLPPGAIPIMVPMEGSPPPPPVPRREHSASRVPGNGPVTPPRPLPRRNVGDPAPPVPPPY